jgi:hypothetical protein
MKQYGGRFAAGLLFVGFIAAVPACVVVHERPSAGLPPPWAPAHGYRAKHVYYYYPGQYVYYDTVRQIYFYQSGGGWASSAALPAGVRIDVRSYRVLEMDSDAPYTYHHDVVKRYPPGQAKKQEKGWDRNGDGDRDRGKDRN